MGTSVENNDYIHRIDTLRLIPAQTRFLSLEPLIGPIHQLDLNQIHWVIAGGESGPKSRPIDIEWVREIRDQCIAQNTPFFFKQWGGTNKKGAPDDFWILQPGTNSPASATWQTPLITTPRSLTLTRDREPWQHKLPLNNKGHSHPRWPRPNGLSHLRGRSIERLF